MLQCCNGWVDQGGRLQLVPSQVTIHKERFDGRNNKLDLVDLSSACQLSVIDLLGDGGASKHTDQNSVRGREAHVAFSVEGLGKVETETPVNSPEIPGRASLNDFSSQRKSRRQLFPSQHLDRGIDDIVYMEDAMAQDVDFLPSKGFVDQSFSVRDTTIRNPSQKFSSFRNSSQSKRNNSPLKGVFDDDELLCGSTDIWSGTSEIWNGPSFLEESSGYLREYESFSKNWMDQRDFSCDGYSKIKDQQRQDFRLDMWSLDNRRSRTCSKRTPNHFDIAEPHPYQKPQIHDELPDFKVPDMSWYLNVGVDSDDAKDTLNRFADDTRESLSLLSEESTTSTAVRGDEKSLREMSDHEKANIGVLHSPSHALWLWEVQIVLLNMELDDCSLAKEAKGNSGVIATHWSGNDLKLRDTLLIVWLSRRNLEIGLYRSVGVGKKK